MSEVLGDAEPFRDGDDFRADQIDDYEYDDGFADEPGTVRRALGLVLAPGALAIASLVIAASNVLLPFSGYVVTTALSESHRGQELYVPRAFAVTQLVVALITTLIATMALRGTTSLPDEDRRTPQLLGGSAVLISVFALLQGVAALILLANTHIPSAG
ncbi:MAG TPA: hypothetical protein VFN80_11380 [Acidothermaceae bacterium]|nr:hypothetical protein [Acidothermaceae bacterium]